MLLVDTETNDPMEARPISNERHQIPLVYAGSNRDFACDKGLCIDKRLAKKTGKRAQRRGVFRNGPHSSAEFNVTTWPINASLSYFKLRLPTKDEVHTTPASLNVAGERTSLLQRECRNFE